METRTAVAANPKEMALALVAVAAASAPLVAAAASSLATTSAAGSDAVPEPAIPIPAHGLVMLPATARGCWLPIREHLRSWPGTQCKKCTLQFREVASLPDSGSTMYCSMTECKASGKQAEKEMAENSRSR